MQNVELGVSRSNTADTFFWVDSPFFATLPLYYKNIADENWLCCFFF